MPCFRLQVKQIRCTLHQMPKTKSASVVLQACALRHREVRHTLGGSCTFAFHQRFCVTMMSLTSLGERRGFWKIIGGREKRGAGRPREESPFTLGNETNMKY